MIVQEILKSRGKIKPVRLDMIGRICCEVNHV